MSDFDPSTDTDPTFFDQLRSRQPTVLHGRPLSPADAAQILNVIDLEVSRVISRYGITERFPAQPPTGSLLRWERQFPGRAGLEASGRVYTYVALRCGDRWYVTGRKNEIVSWEQLAELIGDSPCWLVTGYKEIPRPKPDPLDTMTDPALWFETVFGDGQPADGKTEEQTSS